MCEWKKKTTVWILISWRHEKPADLDLHCFLKRVLSFEKKSYVHSMLIRLNIAVNLIQLNLSKAVTQKMTKD